MVRRLHVTVLLLVVVATTACSGAGADARLQPICDAARDALDAQDVALREQTREAWSEAADAVEQVAERASTAGLGELASAARAWRERTVTASGLEDRAEQFEVLFRGDPDPALEIASTCELAGFSVYGGDVEPVERDAVLALSWLVLGAALVTAVVASRRRSDVATAVRTIVLGFVAGAALVQMLSSVVLGVLLSAELRELLAGDVDVLSLIVLHVTSGELLFVSLVLGGVPGAIIAAVVARRRRTSATVHEDAVR